ncbi:expressed unknown protein [Seminavis robusta]|uniref:Uncharacterized protein n=1 Tax=Seminavis robusta TaxID=568900 RepID=A0A9N8EC88_9STRA|nr:expressed unknown protein [Seminavis robusta]|eukprot:Sro961_g224960.1 n/a (277) ;mRNA; r:10908-11738
MNMEMDMAHKTGYFSGHAVAGTGFITFGVFYLLLTLHRARNLPNGVSFADAHIPEKNHSFLMGAGLVLIPVTMFGVCFEAPGWDNIIAPATHVTLYLTIMLVGVAALLEGMKRLPQDSSRRCLVFAMICQYILWNEHAMLKQVPADFRLHELLAQLCLVGAAVMAYSIMFPKHVIAFVMQPGICVLMGTWLYTGGFYAAYIDIPVGLVGIILVLEALVIATIILLSAAFLVPQSYGHRLDSQPLSYRSLPGREIIDDKDTLTFFVTNDVDCKQTNV